MTTRYALVPVEATEEMEIVAANAMLHPTVYMGGPSVLARRRATKIMTAGLSAAPHAGRVSRAQVEAVADAARREYWGVTCNTGDPPRYWRDLHPGTRRIWTAVAEAAIAALGLTVDDAAEGA